MYIILFISPRVKPKLKIHGIKISEFSVYSKPFVSNMIYIVKQYVQEHRK